MLKSLLSKRNMAAAAVLFVSTSAFAQSTVIVTQPAPPPPGAVVVREAPPAEVRTYVMKQQVPSVTYEGDVLVGRVLPQSVETHVIDGYGNYAYTVVNERRVVVDPQTREVIQVLD